LPKQSILAIDVGAGTQDILLYEPGKPIENCVQLILPSPTAILARRVAEATRARQAIFLGGNLMGGGAIYGAVRAHLMAGLPVFATPLAASTLHDDLAQVQAMGVGLATAQPAGTVPILLHDVDLAALGAALAPFAVALPRTVAVAVQDHGYSPHGSNRAFRFAHWRRFVEGGGELTDLLYVEPPPYLTRMLAVQRDAPGAYLMDTGAAAIWGALCDDYVAAHSEEGVVVVNAGNGHTVAALVRGRRVFGLAEDHTGAMTTAKLADYVSRLRAGSLSNEEVFAGGGHGCYVAPDFVAGDGFRFVAVTGPNRRLAEGLGYHFAVPNGDMMLAGCFGLVAAVQARTDQPQRTQRAQS